MDATLEAVAQQPDEAAAVAAPETEPEPTPEPEPAPPPHTADLWIDARDAKRLFAADLAAKKSTVPVIEQALLRLAGDGISLVTTDLDGVHVRSATVHAIDLPEGPFAVVVERKTLATLIGMAPADGAIHLTVREDDCTIEIGEGLSTTLANPFPVDQFPDTPSLADEMSKGATLSCVAHVPASAMAGFLTLLHRAMRYTSSSTARPVFHAVLFESSRAGLKLVAADSYRVVEAWVPGVTDRYAEEEPLQVLVDSEALKRIIKCLLPGEGLDIAATTRDEKDFWDRPNAVRRVHFVQPGGNTTIGQVNGVFPRIQSVTEGLYPTTTVRVPAKRLEALLKTTPKDTMGLVFTLPLLVLDGEEHPATLEVRSLDMDLKQRWSLMAEVRAWETPEERMPEGVAVYASSFVLNPEFLQDLLPERVGGDVVLALDRVPERSHTGKVTEMVGHPVTAWATADDETFSGEGQDEHPVRATIMPLHSTR